MEPPPPLRRTAASRYLKLRHLSHARHKTSAYGTFLALTSEHLCLQTHVELVRSEPAGRYHKLMDLGCLCSVELAYHLSLLYPQAAVPEALTMHCLLSLDKVRRIHALLNAELLLPQAQQIDSRHARNVKHARLLSTLRGGRIQTAQLRDVLLVSHPKPLRALCGACLWRQVGGQLVLGALKAVLLLLLLLCIFKSICVGKVMQPCAAEGLKLLDALADLAFQYQSPHVLLVFLLRPEARELPHVLPQLPLVLGAAALLRMLLLVVQEVALKDEGLAPNPLLQLPVVSFQNLHLELLILFRVFLVVKMAVTNQLFRVVFPLYIHVAPGRHEPNLVAPRRLILVVLDVLPRDTLGLNHVLLPLALGELARHPPRTRNGSLDAFIKVNFALGKVDLRGGLGDVGHGLSRRGVDVVGKVVQLAVTFLLGAYDFCHLLPVTNTIRVNAVQQRNLLACCPPLHQDRKV
mmetsp:Transcript_37358/g.72989  ORF Transcript_37358/g.72989 Transcript_37358/m.72989 type:complete len:463 (+) Transcript_37358:7-1395(+)